MHSRMGGFDLVNQREETLYAVKSKVNNLGACPGLQSLSRVETTTILVRRRGWKSPATVIILQSVAKAAIPDFAWKKAASGTTIGS